MSSEDIKPGYKRTELGVIPEDWRAETFEKITTHIGDGLHGTPIYSLNGDYFFVNGNNLSGGKVVVTGETKTVDYAEFDKYRKPLNKRSILLSINGTIGNLALFNDEKILLGKSVAFINIRQGICIKFIYYALQTDFLRNQFLDGLTGSTINNLSLTIIRNTSVPLPSTEAEQRAISTALSDMDALLFKLDQLIAKKRDLKQATMQQLLTGQIRLPGFSGDWEIKRLGDIGNCLRGVTYKGDSDLKPHDTEQTKRLLRSNNVKNSAIIIEDIQFVDANRVAPQQLLRRNDILICMANGSKALVGKAGFFDVDDGYEYTFGAFMGCFRTRASESASAFVFYLFQTARYRDYINNLLAGSSINNLNPGSIESLEFHIPAMIEQIAIATVLSDMDAELACLEARRDKTLTVKQGMLQELLTGRIRLTGRI